ncbi:hypothetical protein OEZ86_011860 [Tetradesmus obliquus]|nr:hypothetical protein OEZ86_011860 [Tetradesmus obliquus]
MTKDEEGPLKFQGYMPYPPKEGIDDWGLNAVEQENHVEHFRRILVEHNAWRREDHDYYTLLRFLRARNYIYDKAVKMWLDTIEWRKEYDVDNILENFVFHEREQFLMAYPQGYHKTDKLGRPIYIQLLGKIDIGTLKQITTEERMIKFHIQEYERCGKVIMPICSKLQGRQIDQTFGIMDVKGVGMSHLSGEVKRLMSTLTKYDQDNYPEMLGRICIINAPFVFKAIWGLVKPLLNPRTLSKIQICQTNYQKDLLEWVAPENLPEWLGGTSKGTLLDDCGPWSDPEVLRRMEGSLPVACKALKRMATLSGMGEVVLQLEDGEGYHSPRSEASFVSISSSTAPSEPLLSHAGSGAWVPGSGPARSSLSAAEEAGVGDATPGEASSSVQQHGSMLTIAAINAHKQSSLLERLSSLEGLYGQQMQRLKGYMPANATARLQGRLAPPRTSGGGVLQRLEVLEEGMELLLRAQELSWQADEAKKRDRCCRGCVIC